MLNSMEKDRTIWFSMWFLGALATFGVAFFPMFYRLIDNRNRHFRREAELEERIAEWFADKGGKTLAVAHTPDMRAKAWAASIVLIIPALVIVYYLSKDLQIHERHQDLFLEKAFPERMFMPQTVPIRKYALITIFTLGVGAVYWLYKIANLYNAHFRAQWKVEQEIGRLMEGKTVGEHL